VQGQQGPNAPWADLLNDAIWGISDQGDANATAVAGKVGKGELVINVKDYGTKGDGVTDDTDAVKAAATAAGSGGLHFPAGAYPITGDLVFSGPIDLSGSGEGSRLNFTGGGLVFDGTTGFLMRPTLRGLRIARTGTAGPALHMKGAGNGTGVARVTASDLHLSSAGGEALLYEGSYIGTFLGCYFESSLYGIRGKIETATNVVGTNALTFIGGESNGNSYGWDFDRPSGVSFYGFCTEGNLVQGGKIHGVARGFVYHGGYFEGNQGQDIEVDCNAGAGGILIEGNAFFTTGMTKTESILLRRGRVAVNNNHFNGLIEADGDVAIRVNEGTSPVFGEARNNMSMKADGSDMAPTVIAYTVGGAAFNVTQLGQVTQAGNGSVVSSALNEQAGIAFVRKVSSILDFPSIAAGGEATLTVSVPGAVVTDDCAVSSSMLEPGLSVSSWGVTAADTVSIRLRNNTAAAIDPSARNWRVRVWR
jgi:hypothetical protein